MVEYSNVMESVVREKIIKTLSEIEGCCMCDQCISDMMCIILNKLPSKYANTKTGEVLTKMSSITKKDEVDIMNLIAESYIIVRDSPRH